MKIHNYHINFRKNPSLYANSSLSTIPVHVLQLRESEVLENDIRENINYEPTRITKYFV
jgi:hypothetical protein